MIICVGIVPAEMYTTLKCLCRMYLVIIMWLNGTPSKMLTCSGECIVESFEVMCFPIHLSDVIGFLTGKPLHEMILVLTRQRMHFKDVVLFPLVYTCAIRSTAVTT